MSMQGSMDDNTFLSFDCFLLPSSRSNQSICLIIYFDLSILLSICCYTLCLVHTSAINISFVISYSTKSSLMSMKQHFALHYALQNIVSHLSRRIR